MTETLIKVDNLSKKFCRSLRRSLWYGVRDLGSELAGSRKDHRELRPGEFWALKDVFMEVKRGQSIGLIGRNGAGKTTLMRLLNGLIKPDAGRIEVKGRMQALIGLGAGFNPVLTGRENIYVNAAVLGIPKSVVDRRFDEIVDFSGVGDFIDTPVQSYSSGMAVRLGFSVAVYMDPDILLVDEVLAVGDIPFRAKCHKKLGEFKERGIPWILVSHDMGTIRNQTNLAIFLEQGRVKYCGSPDDAIGAYLYSLSNQEQLMPGGKEKEAKGRDSAGSNQDALIEKVTLLDGNNQEKEFFETGETLVIRIDYIAEKKLEKPAFGIAIYSGEGVCFTGTNTAISEYEIDYIQGHGSVYYEMNSLALLPGIYRVRADIHDKHLGLVDKDEEGAYLHIKGGKFSPGLFYIPHTWNITKVSNGRSS